MKNNFLVKIEVERHLFILGTLSIFRFENLATIITILLHQKLCEKLFGVEKEFMASHDVQSTSLFTTAQTKMFWDTHFKRCQGPIHNLKDRNALNLFLLCKRPERTSTVQTQIALNVAFVIQLALTQSNFKLLFVHLNLLLEFQLAFSTSHFVEKLQTFYKVLQVMSHKVTDKLSWNWLHSRSSSLQARCRWTAVE